MRAVDLRVHIHHHRPNLAGTTARVIDCSNDRLIDAIDGNDDDIASWQWRAVITRERDLFSDGLVVRADRTEHQDQYDNEEKDDPGALCKLGAGNDDGGQCRS